MQDAEVSSQNRKNPMVYAPRRLRSANRESMSSIWGSKAAKNKMVAAPAIRNEGHSIAMTRWIFGVCMVRKTHGVFGELPTLPESPGADKMFVCPPHRKNPLLFPTNSLYLSSDKP